MTDEIKEAIGREMTWGERIARLKETDDKPENDSGYIPQFPGFDCDLCGKRVEFRYGQNKSTWGYRKNYKVFCSWACYKAYEANESNARRVHKWTKEEDEVILRMRRAGAPFPEIGKALGVSYKIASYRYYRIANESET